MTIGEKILNMRKARGWSQEELAEHIGVTRQAVSRWEAGSAKPDADKIIAICDLFDISADYLLREQYSSERMEPTRQESGETVQQEKQETALGALLRRMTLAQWAGLGIFVLGVVVIVVLFLLFFFADTNYSYSYYGWPNDYHYDGFPAFLRCEGVFVIWYGAFAAMAAGVIMMLWHKIKKWNILVAIHNWSLEYRGLSPEE